MLSVTFLPFPSKVLGDAFAGMSALDALAVFYQRPYDSDVSGDSPVTAEVA